MSLVQIDQTAAPVAIDHAAIMRELRLDPTKPQTQALLLICDRYRLDPILRHIVLIDGRPYITRDGLLEVAHHSGQFDGIEVVDEGETKEHWWAKVSVYRKDMSHAITYRGRYPKSGSNKKFGPEMATKVAEVMALRRAFSVTGMPVAEEAWDAIDVTEAQVREHVPPAELLPDEGMVNKALAKNCILDAYSGDVEAAMKAWDINFADDPDELDVDDLRDVLAAIAPPDFEPMTKPMLAKLHAILGERGVGNDQRHAFLSERVGREITSASEITKDEGRRLIDDLEREAAA